MKQLKMNFNQNYKREFGGELLLNKRKSKRPLSIKKPIHLVIRSEQAKVFTPWNFSLETFVHKLALQFNIKIYDLSLNWNHIHAVIKIKDRQDYVRFIRSLTSILAARIRTARNQVGVVFSLRPFTRILEWGRDFKNALSYVLINQLESVALVQSRKSNRHLGKQSGVRAKRRN